MANQFDVILISFLTAFTCWKFKIDEQNFGL